MDKTSQVIKCKCGAVSAAYIAPDCYTDSEWMKDVRKYVKKGYTVDIVHGKLTFQKCKCNELSDTKQLNLF